MLLNSSDPWKCRKCLTKSDNPGIFNPVMIPIRRNASIMYLKVLHNIEKGVFSDEIPVRITVRTTFAPHSKVLHLTWLYPAVSYFPPYILHYCWHTQSCCSWRMLWYRWHSVWIRAERLRWAFHTWLEAGWSKCRSLWTNCDESGSWPVEMVREFWKWGT